MEIFRQILSRYWGYSRFRPLQAEIIQSVYEGKDTLGLMPTGGGKSITFQVPALAREGICLVITPLIALMKDQVENLRKKEIMAIAIHSGMSYQELDIALDNCIYGNVKFLYLSPERLETELFRIRLQKMNVSFLAIDESHCVSQWGYDFRPSYLKIREIRELLPDVPLLALTATATPIVVDDIMEKLGFREKNVFRKSFDRSNIIYDVVFCEDKIGKIIQVIRDNQGSGIIYVRMRKKTRDLAQILQKEGIKADYYHAGLTFAERSRKQEDWQHGATQVIVSTNAFGMGIDKPDVRFVIHPDVTDSLEAYYQEAGRAGRDEKPALALLLYNESDRKSADQRIKISFPEFKQIREVYHALGNFLQVPIGSGKGQGFDFILSDFISRFHFNATTAHNCLAVLQRERYIDITEEINNPSRVHFVVSRDDLYKFQVANENLDAFIKLLLRSYSGMFSSFIPIDEHQLAKRSGVDHDTIYKYLLKLSSSGIIQYIPRRKNPVLTWTEERLSQDNLAFSTETYRFLKERFTERLNEMIAYASLNNRCRNTILREYFGEKDVTDCGRCDVCRTKKSRGPDRDEYQGKREFIITLLESRPMTLTELAEKGNFTEEVLQEVFRQMIEQGEIRRDENYFFHLLKH